MELWAECFQHLDSETGEILATRDELATAVEAQPDDISRIMGELERVGAISRRREGRGVRYFMNPRVGTHLGGKARDDAQAQAVQLRFMAD